MVLYENVYEIYGDIRGAKNCFRFKAYAQGNPFYLYISLGALFCKFMYSVVGFTVLVSLTLLLVMILVLGIGINF